MFDAIQCILTHFNTLQRILTHSSHFYAFLRTFKNFNALQRNSTHFNAFQRNPTHFFHIFLDKKYPNPGLPKWQLLLPTKKSQKKICRKTKRNNPKKITVLFAKLLLVIYCFNLPYRKLNSHWYID